MSDTKKASSSKRTPEQVMKDYSNVVNSSDPEVREKALEKFPNFLNYSNKLVSGYYGIVHDALASCDSSQRAFYTGCLTELNTIQTMLEKGESLTSDERLNLVDQMSSITKRMAEKDTEIRDKTYRLLETIGKLGAYLIVTGGIVYVTKTIADAAVSIHTAKTVDQI